jgi:hypothetical protein
MTVGASRSTSIAIMHLFFIKVTALEVLDVQRSLNACLYRTRALNINALGRAMTAWSTYGGYQMGDWE